MKSRELSCSKNWINRACPLILRPPACSRCKTNCRRLFPLPPRSLMRKMNTTKSKKRIASTNLGRILRRTSVGHPFRWLIGSMRRSLDSLNRSAGRISSVNSRWSCILSACRRNWTRLIRTWIRRNRSKRMRSRSSMRKRGFLFRRFKLSRKRSVVWCKRLRKLRKSKNKLFMSLRMKRLRIAKCYPSLKKSLSAPKNKTS